MKPVIGITGHARAGKDTVAARLIEHHGFTRVAFADPLKAVLLETDPYVDAEVDDDYGVQPYTLSEVMYHAGWEYAKDTLPEVRRLLQNLGQAMREVVDEDIWLNAALRRIDATPGPVVVTDVRYPNEAAAIQRIGTLVRVTRPGYDGANDHLSEHALDDWKVGIEIVNDADLRTLERRADAMVARARAYTATRSAA